jgi:hypothetical protein
MAPDGYRRPADGRIPPQGLKPQWLPAPFSVKQQPELEEYSMSDTNGHKSAPDENEDFAELDSEEYDAMALLDQLESLEEEMEELGVTTLDEVRQRIRDLHEQLGE